MIAFFPPQRPAPQTDEGRALGLLMAVVVALYLYYKFILSKQLQRLQQLRAKRAAKASEAVARKKMRMAEMMGMGSEEEKVGGARRGEGGGVRKRNRKGS